MTDSKNPSPRLAVELDKIQKWRQERLASHQRYLAEIDEEDNRLRQKLTELERKLKANNQLREQVLNQLRKLPVEEGLRSHSALKEALGEDREILETRATALLHLHELERAELEKALEDPENAKALEEYEKFQEIRPTLEMLPASYRQVIEAHHESLTSRLKPLFELAEGTGSRLEVEDMVVGMIASVDPEDGAPAAFALLVPVDFEIYRDWGERQEDLCSHLAYRAVSAVTRLLVQLDAASAPVAFRDFNGCLSIQVWLGDHVIKTDLKKAAQEILSTLGEGAAEQYAARIHLKPVWVSPYTIAPEDEEERSPEPKPETALPETRDEQEPSNSEDEPLAPSPKEERVQSPNKKKPVKVILRRGGSDDF